MFRSLSQSLAFSFTVRNNQKLSFNTRYMYNSFYCFLFSNRYNLWFVSSQFCFMWYSHSKAWRPSWMTCERKPLGVSYFTVFILLAFSTKFWETWGGLRRQTIRNNMHVKPSNIATKTSPKVKILFKTICLVFPWSMKNVYRKSEVNKTNNSLRNT